MLKIHVSAEHGLYILLLLVCHLPMPDCFDTVHRVVASLLLRLLSLWSPSSQHCFDLFRAQNFIGKLLFILKSLDRTTDTLKVATT